MEELKPMTAAEFFNVTTCLVLPERSAGCLTTGDVVTADGRVLAKAGELPYIEKGYIRVVLEFSECSCCNG